MKMNDLKKRIKETALNEMPDIRHKIDLNSIEIFPETEIETKPLFNWRKAMTITFSFLFLGVISLTAYSIFNTDTVITNPLLTEEQVLSFQAISAASLLDEVEAVPLSFDITPLEDTPEAVIENEIDTINQYLNMMETVLGDTETMVSVSLESDIEEYSNYVLYRNKDLVGNLIEFKLYYNIATTTDGSTLSGVMYHDLKTYFIEGNIDSETETLTSFKVSLDSNHYVTVDDVSDEDGQKYQYKNYTFNALQNEGTVSLQLSNQILNANVETSGVTSQFLLNVERVQTSSTTKFQVRYQITSGSVLGNGEFEVGVEFDQTLGMYHYKYIMVINGTAEEFTCGRGYKGNKEATDDDFTVTGQSTPIGNGHHGMGNGSTTNEVPSTDSMIFNDIAGEINM